MYSYWSATFCVASNATNIASGFGLRRVLVVSFDACFDTSSEESLGIEFCEGKKSTMFIAQVNCYFNTKTMASIVF